MPDNTNRILIAEDEPASLALLQRYLEKAGYEVVPCANGREARDAIHDANCGLVVADWMMPEMDGLQLLQYVREMQSLGALGGIYYILLTALTEKERVVEGLEAGADDYLVKPYHRQELLARIRAGQRIQSLQAELLARQRELALANVELEALSRRLSVTANTDELTRLPNRRAVFERMGDYFSLAKRHGNALSFIMFDVDRFKSVNDTYGHGFGDTVLQAIAERLQQTIRRHDLCGRLGGEEFCVACLETDIVGAVRLAERLRYAIEHEPISAGGTSLVVTVSLGVVQCTAQHGTIEAMVSEADQMLYKAKEHGRNQVWFVDSDGTPRAALASPQPM